MKFYILVVSSGVDAESAGPFPTEAARDLQARELFQSPDFSPDYDSIFRLDMENDRPAFYPFAYGELGEDAEAVASRI